MYSENLAHETQSPLCSLYLIIKILGTELLTFEVGKTYPNLHKFSSSLTNHKTKLKNQLLVVLMCSKYIHHMELRG